MIQEIEHMSNEKYLEQEEFKEFIHHILNENFKKLFLPKEISSEFEINSTSSEAYVTLGYLINVLPYVDLKAAEYLEEIFCVIREKDDLYLSYGILETLKGFCSHEIQESKISKNTNLACLEISEKWDGKKIHKYRSIKECTCRNCQEMKEIL